MARCGGFCEYAECFEPAVEMAHLEGSGMGGSVALDVLDNVAMLCKYHHDLLDGREHHGLRREHGRLLAEVIRLRFDLSSWRRGGTPDERGDNGEGVGAEGTHVD